MIVKCPQCGISYYETTDEYKADVRPNGAMLKLRDPWLSLGWATYGLDRGEGAGLLWSDLECTGCAAPLAPSGTLMVIGTPEAPPEMISPFTCGVCEKACKSSAGLKAHKRSHE